MKTINHGNKGTVTITADYSEIAVLQLALKKLMTQTNEKALAEEASRLLHDVSNPVTTLEFERDTPAVVTDPNQPHTAHDLDFDLTAHLPDVEITEEHYEDGGYSRFKQKHYTDGLSLILFESGEATLEGGNFESDAMITFLWDKHVGNLFAHINEVSVVDLFAELYRRRWIGAKVEVGGAYK
ncbi:MULTISPECIES: hypothetical protein [unclassified Virgibacillus]|uniref:hypothetical protein n=1 Tax=unclassified Virgibacillus TaxID=2620237 RepID=UPI00090A417D|nr:MULTISPECIES: hypothetical protein [unclassified Virgibacillus]API93484.1 hypothetical protein BKP57_17725 [Virgibacillus sp. 6R]MBS7430128.1 hypothetical protein [Virgibacillus sp. 19R1-5]